MVEIRMISYATRMLHKWYVNVSLASSVPFSE